MAVDRQRRFGGIGRLYGDRALEQLARLHVCVVGVGGVGSWAVEALARSGVGRLTLLDMDHIAESNVNRQIQALEGDFGKSKVLALAERIGGINADARVDPIELFAEPDTLAQVIDPGHDYIVDCIDGFRNKAALIAHCRRGRIPLITVGGAGGMMDPTRVRIADLSRSEQDPLLAKTRKLLRGEYGFPRNTKRRFDVPCVYSDEQFLVPVPNGCASVRPATPGSGLNCGGYGAVVTVTAVFGMTAVSHVLKKLLS